MSPRELDESLLEHPAVAQVVACAGLYKKMGGEIAAVAVLKSGSALTPSRLRETVRKRLAGDLEFG